MEILETILSTILIASWTALSLVLLVVTIQEVINNRKQEKRDVEREKRELEYHEARMKELRK